jgi:hypothetical protein
METLDYIGKFKRAEIISSFIASLMNSGKSKEDAEHIVDCWMYDPAKLKIINAMAASAAASHKF